MLPKRKPFKGVRVSALVPVFDTFLCYNSEDRIAVEGIGFQLVEQGLKPWFDEWEIRPGVRWQRLLEEQILQIKSATVFIGESGIGPWQHLEIEAFLSEFIKRQCPIIPVILSSYSDLEDPNLPVFLRGIQRVDFRKNVPDPLDRLIWGITGKRSIGTNGNGRIK
jgi:hypothetical protein